MRRRARPTGQAERQVPRVRTAGKGNASGEKGQEQDRHDRGAEAGEADRFATEALEIGVQDAVNGLGHQRVPFTILYVPLMFHYRAR